MRRTRGCRTARETPPGKLNAKLRARQRTSAPVTSLDRYTGYFPVEVTTFRLSLQPDCIVKRSKLQMDNKRERGGGAEEKKG